jgi:hypothetical protein
MCEPKELTYTYIDIQAGLFLRDFALTRHENLHHLSNLRENVRFNAIWYRRYAVILGLTRFGIDDTR